mmetsp:Transcript_19429/g.45966  ORF Transcript_19429/g.45966 Transcript_19429/m.45966 type:complete len:295 (-) Transcript_19429:55-939(-)
MKQIHCSGCERVLYSLVWLWLLSERAGRIEGFTVGGPRIRPSPTSTSPHHRVPALNRIGYSPSSSCSRCLYTTRHQYQKESAEDQSSNKKQTRPKRAPKPPRFTQTVHGGGTNAKGDKKKNNNKQEVQKDRMWNSRKKSIEELEVIMNKRWGTSLNTFTAQDYYDDDDEEEENNHQQQHQDNSLKCMLLNHHHHHRPLTRSDGKPTPLHLRTGGRRAHTIGTSTITTPAAAAASSSVVSATSSNGRAPPQRRRRAPLRTQSSSISNNSDWDQMIAAVAAQRHQQQQHVVTTEHT